MRQQPWELDDAAESAVWKELARLARLDAPRCISSKSSCAPLHKIFFQCFFFFSVSSAAQCGHTGKGHCEWLACVWPIKNPSKALQIMSCPCLSVAHNRSFYFCRQSWRDDTCPEDLTCRYEDRYNQTTPIQSLFGDASWHECKYRKLNWTFDYLLHRM